MHILTRTKGVHDIHARRPDCGEDTTEKAHDKGESQGLIDNTEGEGKGKGEFGKGLKVHGRNGKQLHK